MTTEAKAPTLSHVVGLIEALHKGLAGQVALLDSLNIDPKNQKIIKEMQSDARNISSLSK